MNEIAIQIEDLYAQYGKDSKAVQALQGVNLAIHKGEIFGLLGPNGAGKTTLLSCLEGLHTPLKGSVKVAGIDVTLDPQRVKGMLGIQLQRSAFLDGMKVVELVQFYAGLYEIFLSSAQVSRLLEQFELQEVSKRTARSLSGGQLQRLALVMAIVNDPQIVLLDEPTGALDPHARRRVWNLIRQMHEQGRTVLITTHSMEEAEALCGRVAIIDRGQVIACDTPLALTNDLGSNSMLKTSLDVPLEWVRNLSSVKAARYSGQYLEIETSQPQETLGELQKLAKREGRLLGEVTLRPPNLEDVFLQLTGHSLLNGRDGNTLD